jgi:hypothetical protein
MANGVAEIERLAAQVSSLIPHRFEIITRLDDGTAIPPEALSEDHSLGLYGEIVPYKMRENLAGYRQIEIADLVPQQELARSATGMRAGWFLEYPPLRDVRFRAERLQYLEEGWWAVTAEVKYPAETTLALLYTIKQLYGAAHLYLNTELPMPLWIRPAPLGEETQGAQAVIQARGEGRILSTNIHTECPMETARRWAGAARNYYRIAEL